MQKGRREEWGCGREKSIPAFLSSTLKSNLSVTYRRKVGIAGVGLQQEEEVLRVTKAGQLSRHQTSEKSRS